MDSSSIAEAAASAPLAPAFHVSFKTASVGAKFTSQPDSDRATTCCPSGRQSLNAAAAFLNFSRLPCWLIEPHQPGAAGGASYTATTLPSTRHHGPSCLSFHRLGKMIGAPQASAEQASWSGFSKHWQAPRQWFRAACLWRFHRSELNHRAPSGSF